MLAPPPIVAVYNWTGCYVGGNGGGLWGHKDGGRSAAPEACFPVMMSMAE